MQQLAVPLASHQACATHVNLLSHCPTGAHKTLLWLPLFPLCTYAPRFITFAEESSVAAVFGAGSMQEINGKRVEVKAATPKGSGPVGRGAAMGPMAGRGMGYAYPPRGMLPGRYPADYGWAMHPGRLVPANNARCGSVCCDPVCLWPLLCCSKCFHNIRTAAQQ